MHVLHFSVILKNIRQAMGSHSRLLIRTSYLRLSPIATPNKSQTNTSIKVFMKRSLVVLEILHVFAICASARISSFSLLRLATKFRHPSLFQIMELAISVVCFLSVAKWSVIGNSRGVLHISVYYRDLNMLCMLNAGERTLDEFKTLGWPSIVVVLSHLTNIYASP